MLSVVLKILSILGIFLLCLLGVALLLILLALFFPISYKLTGRKDPEKMAVSARASWLFGFLRVRYDYPKPGTVLVRVLPFTVFDSGKVTGKEKKDASGSSQQKAEEKNGAEEGVSADAGQDPPLEAAPEQASGTDREKDAALSAEDSRAATEDNVSGGAATENTAAGSGPSGTSAEEEAGNDADPAILKKIKKIKYTIRGIYDKIKNIWENISYYFELLQEEETGQLFSHVMLRLGKIWKNIRPGRIRGQVLFGTGSPDTTGYAYGVYGMMSPLLGDRLLVTPDFTRAVLEGEVDISGHITVVTILWNAGKLLLDKKLRRFISKMKAGRKK
ncbi:MAG: hypothetical protein NC420_04595 [Eubacterium sp.]|nr:hypothetical protein [Eubacterium sp.]